MDADREGLVYEAVRRIVEVADPLRVLLFGSAARGQTRQDSDVDLLVVVAENTDKNALLKTIYTRLYGVAIAVDVLLVTESDIERYGASQCLVIYPALRDGIEIYRAQPTTLPSRRSA